MCLYIINFIELITFIYIYASSIVVLFSRAFIKDVNAPGHHIFVTFYVHVNFFCVEVRSKIEIIGGW